MIEMIKEIGIFIVIAQAVLYLVPGENYEKYVKVIIGIIMIAKMVQPVFGVFSEDLTDDTYEKFLEQSESLFEVPEQESETLQSGDSKMAILKSLEEELKTKLDEKPAEGYRIEEVSIISGQTEEDFYLSITVSEEKSTENAKIEIEKVTVGEDEKENANMTQKEEEILKEYYGQILGITPQQIEICLN